MSPPAQESQVPHVKNSVHPFPVIGVLFENQEMIEVKKSMTLSDYIIL